MADVTLDILIKDQYVSRVAEAIDGIKDKPFYLEIGGADGNLLVNFSLDHDGLTPKQLAKHLILQFLKGIVKSHELKVDTQRFNGAVAEIPEPTQTVPEDVIE